MKVNILNLSPGQRVELRGFQSDPTWLATKFAELGVVPGTTIVLGKRAPFGGPVQLLIGSFVLAVGRSEAANLIVSLIN